MCTDPGAVPKDALPLLDDVQESDPEANDSSKFRKYCKRCQAFKPVRAHHCSICGRCIVKMDHHCPWVNNCVGLGNHKLFLLFLFWVNVISCYAVVMVMARFVACVAAHTASDSKECGTPHETLYTIFLLVESILFGLFTFCMMSDQASAVADNQTQIDRLKNEKHVVKTTINEVFGTSNDVRCSLSWVVPVPVQFPEATRDSIRGYRLLRDPDYSELSPLTANLSEDSHELQGRDHNRDSSNEEEMSGDQWGPGPSGLGSDGPQVQMQIQQPPTKEVYGESVDEFE